MSSRRKKADEHLKNTNTEKNVPNGRTPDRVSTSSSSSSGIDDAQVTITGPVPPDGGWGWVITFSSFMISVLVDGVCFSFGIFFSHFLKYFGGSKGKTALLGAVLNGAYLTLGPVTSALVNNFGCRIVAISGSIMAAVGFFLCTFSPNLDVMIFLFGAVGGCGFGLMYLPAIVMVGHYFEKKRAFATGIAVCGSGIGGFVFAPLCEFLLHEYFWHGAMWIISGMALNGIVFSTFFRPLEAKKVTKSEQILNSGDKTDHNHVSIVISEVDGWKSKPVFDFETNGLTPIYRCKSVEMSACGNDSACLARLAYSQGFVPENSPKQKDKHEKDVLNPLSRKDIFYSGSLRHIPEYQQSKNENDFIEKMTLPNTEETEDKEVSFASKMWHSLSSSFDFSLLKSPTFMIYGSSCFLCMFGFFIPFNFLPDLANDLHVSSHEAALLISIIGITNTISRIAVGFVSDQKWADCLIINNVSLIIGGVASFFVPHCTNFPQLAVYCVIFGAAIASFVSLRSIIMVELMGIDKLTNAFGLVVLCQGLSSFIGSPVAGAVSDMTGNYDITFYLAGGTIFFAGFICLPLRRISNWEKNKDKRNEMDATKNKNENCPEEAPMLEKGKRLETDS